MEKRKKEWFDDDSFWQDVHSVLRSRPTRKDPGAREACRQSRPRSLFPTTDNP